MIKYIGLLSILLPLSTSTFCGVISSTYSDDGHKLNTYNYFYKGDVFKRCDQKNDCEDLFNKNKKYCNNILKLKDKDDIQVRIRWECPRYESIKQFSVHDKFHRILVLSGFFFLKIASTFLNSSFFPKPIKRRIAI